jgi:hypothetical protein
MSFNIWNDDFVALSRKASAVAGCKRLFQIGHAMTHGQIQIELERIWQLLRGTVRPDYEGTYEETTLLRFDGYELRGTEIPIEDGDFAIIRYSITNLNDQILS